ncbi:MAG: VWA domain-containing protein, partial [Pyrinomonadaceae bacterium]
GIGRRIQLSIGALLILSAFCPINSGQTPKQKPSSQGLERKLDEQSQGQTDEVVRIRTELVQTSVVVLDKRGKFVDNLRADEFELRIDGKPYPVSFFERVVNGIASETLKGGEPRHNAAVAPAVVTNAVRTVLFFVDDLHLSAESITRARKMLSNYIEQQMGVSDQAVIASASGQIGFLQQLTGEREVLRAAVGRLTYRPLNLLDTERPRMTAYQAHLIDQDDEETLTYFEEYLLQSGDLKPLIRSIGRQRAQEIANRRVKSRASRIVRQSSWAATQTLSALRNAVRSSAQIPGRKLIVFVSDGFLINDRNSNLTNELLHITAAAVKVGAVLYTIQASGLNSSFPDASSDLASLRDVGTGTVYGEDVRTQDPLAQLAADSGGKAFFNANDLNGDLKRVLRESNDYYLLAWRPETNGSTAKEFHRIEVTVKGRSDLSILLQRGFYNDDQPAQVIRAVEKPRVAETFPLEGLAAAIQGKPNNRPLPTYLTVNYLDLPNRGASLTILMQVENRNGALRAADTPETVDVAGVVYNETGKVVGSFVNTLKPEANSDDGRHITFLDQVNVKPGLYQVRVAAQDSADLTGMAMQWVKVPDLASHHLALSSLLIGQREMKDNGPRDAAQFQKAQLKIDRRFVQGSRLRFLTYVYNAASGAIGQSPQLNARIDIFRGNDPVVSTPAFAIETKEVEDAARIPYAGELNLASLAKGNYRIRVTVIDLSAKAFASQEASFEIE